MALHLLSKIPFLTETHHSHRTINFSIFVTLDMFDLGVIYQLVGMVNGTAHLQSVLVRNFYEKSVILFHQNLFNLLKKSSILKLFFLVGCRTLDLENGRVTYNSTPVLNKYKPTTVASFSCNDDYSLRGPYTKTCQQSGNWSEISIPKCKLTGQLLFLIGLFGVSLFIDLGSS